MSRSQSTPARRRLAEIYRNAARHMEVNKGGFECSYSCLAVDWAVGYKPAANMHSPEAGRYVEAIWGADDKAEYQYAINGDHEFRILALCFMAAMVEARDA